MYRITGGLMIILIGGVAQYLQLHAKDNKYWLGLLAHDLRTLRFPLLFHLQVGESINVFLFQST